MENVHKMNETKKSYTFKQLIRLAKSYVNNVGTNHSKKGGNLQRRGFDHSLNFLYVS